MGRPAWASNDTAMSRFHRGSGQVWVPRPDVPTLTDSKSQDAEDVYAYTHFFYGRGGGTFLEMGALDGVVFSNTYAYDKVLGWRGVLIEASPSSYASLATNRPEQVNVHVAVCDKPQMVHYADAGAECCRGIAEFMSETFLRVWHPSALGGNFNGLPTVPCVPLPFILDQFGIQHINFCVLDVEGGELGVLQSVDFSALSFDVIAIEADGGNPGKDQGVIDLLVSKGYVHYGHKDRSDWFVREGFQPSAAPAAPAAPEA